MTTPIRKLHPDAPQPVALHDRAMDNLQFIRDTMARSSAFTAVSGGAVILMGGIGLFVAILSDTSRPMAWAATWLGAAVLSFSVSTLATSYKASQVGESLLKGPGRKFVLGMLPALLVGGLLAIPFIRENEISFLPSVWLLLYGTAVVSGGAFSVRTIPFMGVSFLILGAISLLAPSVDPNVWMAIGFGGLHVLFGSLIARRHGG